MPIIPQERNSRILSAPLDYPSLSSFGPSFEDNVVLIPTLLPNTSNCVALPAANYEVASELVRRVDRPSLINWHPSPVLNDFSTGLGGTAGYSGNILSIVNEYFDQIYKTRLEAYRSMAEILDRYKKAGGNLTNADYAEIVAKRKVAQQILLSSKPPVFRFETVTQVQFRKWSELSAVIASIPPGQARSGLQREWQLLQDRFVTNFTSKSLLATRSWATRMAKAGKFLVVIEFNANVARLITATNTAEANKAAAELAKQAISISSGAVGLVAQWLAAATAAKLAVFFGLTPLGWVIAGAGIVVGLAAGLYLESVILPKIEPFLDTSDLRTSLP